MRSKDLLDIATLSPMLYNLLPVQKRMVFSTSLSRSRCFDQTHKDASCIWMSRVFCRDGNADLDRHPDSYFCDCIISPPFPVKSTWFVCSEHSGQLQESGSSEKILGNHFFGFTSITENSDVNFLMSLLRWDWRSNFFCRETFCVKMAGAPSDILIISHKLAPFGDNTVCAAHRICSLLLQNGGEKNHNFWAEWWNVWTLHLVLRQRIPHPLQNGLSLPTFLSARHELAQCEVRLVQSP